MPALIQVLTGPTVKYLTDSTQCDTTTPLHQLTSACFIISFWQQTSNEPASEASYRAGHCRASAC